MLIQSNQNYPIQKQNFGAKLVAKEQVLQVIKNEITDFYKNSSPQIRANHFENKKPNPKKIWETFVQKFEEKTKKIPGIVELIIPENKKFTASLRYTSEDKKFTAENIIANGSELLPDKVKDEGKPYNNAIMRIIVPLAESSIKAKQSSNPFFELYYAMLRS